MAVRSIKLTERDYQEILNDDKYRLGFELEFGVRQSIDDDEELEDYTEEQLCRKCIKLCNDLSLDLSYGEDRLDEYTHWHLMVDRSIDEEEEGLGSTKVVTHGLELISPPTPLLVGFDDMDRCFDWIEAQDDCDTTRDCGFHVNLSYGSREEMQKVNLLKLSLLVGEDYTMKLFNRADVEHVQSNIRAILQDVSVDELLSDVTVEKIEEVLLEAMGSGIKYRAVNNKTLPKGYLEFRPIGGAYYHRKRKLIKERIIWFCYCLKAALDPDMLRQEYLKRLYKLFDKIATLSENDLVELIGHRPAQFAHSTNALNRIKDYALKCKSRRTRAFLKSALTELYVNGPFHNRVSYTSSSILFPCLNEMAKDESGRLYMTDLVHLYRMETGLKNFSHVVLRSLANTGPEVIRLANCLSLLIQEDSSLNTPYVRMIIAFGTIYQRLHAEFGLDLDGPAMHELYPMLSNRAYYVVNHPNDLDEARQVASHLRYLNLTRFDRTLLHSGPGSLEDDESIVTREDRKKIIQLIETTYYPVVNQIARDDYGLTLLGSKGELPVLAAE